MMGADLAGSVGVEAVGEQSDQEGNAAHDLTNFRLGDMVRLGASLRTMGGEASHIEPVASEIARYLYDNLHAGPTDDRACALVRVYKTHAFGGLTSELQEAVRLALGEPAPAASMKCLTLVATSGDKPEWNSRRSSAGHQVIPLVSPEQVGEIPMVAQLIHQFGLEIASVLTPDPVFMLDAEQRTFNVFHVIQALGSPYIPAQSDFVIPYSVASVLGFGGLLPSGDLFAVLLFAKVLIPQGTAELFKTISLNIKTAFLPHDGPTIFEPRQVEESPDARLIESRISALTQLLDVQEQTALEQTRRLQLKNDELGTALRQIHHVQQQLVAKERLASLGALTAGIAHEIKNPLNFVTNFAQLSSEMLEEMGEELALQASRLDEEAQLNLEDLLANLKQNARKIQEHGQRADGIVGTMLSHSRGEGAQPRPTDLNKLLAQYSSLAYQGLRSQDVSFNIALENNFDETIEPLNVTPEHLSRVILNLVNNACYAALEKRKRIGEPFSPKVEVVSRNRGSQVEFRVRDNGDGIPQAIQKSIFDPFFTTKPSGAGTGLGLSLSHDIVVGEHQGELRVESLEGQWTEFIVTIPKRIADHQ